MGRRGITKEDVYNAAQKIAETGIFPTMHIVRNELATGSLGTIHKHLLAWKQERLLKPAIKISAGKDSAKAKEIYAQNLALESTIKLQVKQNTQLSSQIFDLEQENIELKEYRQKVEIQLKNLQHENLDLQQKNTQHDQLLSELKKSHQDYIHFLLQEKNSEIENLKNELRAVHQASMEMIRKSSVDGQELLITERIKNINMIDKMQRLSNKIDRLDAVANACKAKLQAASPKRIKTYTLAEIQNEHGNE